MRWVAILVLMGAAVHSMGAERSYVESILEWRREREQRLKADDGWLTITGLFWLKEGEQTIGSGPDNDIVLPAHSAPERIGTIEHHGGRTVLRWASPTKKPLELKPDTTGRPTQVAFKDITFWVIQRGDRYAIRLRDLQSRLRKEFTGCRWFPVKPEYRIEVRFIPHPEPRKMRVPSVVGIPEEVESPGVAEFELHGRTVRLTAFSSDGSVWFIFRDATSGKSTYGAARFLYADAPRDGKVILDFNKAYNPPCAFTPYATCPLPPRENRLDVPIEAGEMAPPGAAH